MLEDFKAFILKGNVMDLAVGVIIGASFGKIVTSLVTDVLMPPLGLVLGKVDFSNLYINLSGTPVPSLAEAKKAGVPTINYGLFINTVLDFLIVAFCIFVVVKQVSKFQKKVVAAATKECQYCLSSINLAATRCPNCTSILSDTLPAKIGPEATYF